MSNRAFRAVVLGAVIVLLGLASYAVAGGGKHHVKAGTLTGYEENPDVSTVAKGTLELRIDDNAQTIMYELSYSGLEGTVQQAHIHFGKRAINGGIAVFLCSNLPDPPAGTPACPQSGEVGGVLEAADVIGPAGQGIEPGAFGELVAAIRAGHTYANVHSMKWPGGEIRAQILGRKHGDRKKHGDD
jgi:hypothetical protein